MTESPDLLRKHETAQCSGTTGCAPSTEHFLTASPEEWWGYQPCVQRLEWMRGILDYPIKPEALK